MTNAELDFEMSLIGAAVQTKPITVADLIVAKARLEASLPERKRLIKIHRSALSEHFPEMKQGPMPSWIRLLGELYKWCEPVDAYLIWDEKAFKLDPNQPVWEPSI
jgi:hypothetical protein